MDKLSYRELLIEEKKLFAEIQNLIDGGKNDFDPEVRKLVGKLWRIHELKSNKERRVKHVN